MYYILYIHVYKHIYAYIDITLTCFVSLEEDVQGHAIDPRFIPNYVAQAGLALMTLQSWLPES